MTGAPGALSKGRRTKWCTPQVRAALEAAFAHEQNPNLDTRDLFARECGTTVNKISQWFANRRQKEKLAKEKSANQRPPRRARMADEASAAADGAAAADDVDEEMADEEDPLEKMNRQWEEMQRQLAAESPEDADAPTRTLGPDSVRVRLRDATALLAIEHPCYVINVEKGVRMLGGTVALDELP